MELLLFSTMVLLSSSGCSLGLITSSAGLIMICWSWVAAAFIPVMWGFTEHLLLHARSAGSCWTKVPHLSSWIKVSEILSYSFGVEAVKIKLTKPLPTGTHTMPQLWPVLHKLRKSTLEVFPYQINSGPSTTNHRVEQKCDGDTNKQKMRSGDAVSTGNRHPILSVSPRISLPNLALRMTFSTRLGKLHHFWIFVFSPKDEVAAFMPLQRGWDSCNCLQHTPKSHQPLGEIYPREEGFSSWNAPSSCYRSSESWDLCSTVGRAGIQVGP